jgi:NAD(P)H-flavin reductase
MPEFITAQTITNANLAGKFHNIIFETAVPFQFNAGQYVSIKVADAHLNSYSIASRLGNNRFALLIDTAPGGIGSKYFEALKAGDSISFLGPFGKFSLNTNDGAQRLIFLGTGSGVAPLRAMIETGLADRGLKIPISLYFGLRHPDDILWKDYFESLVTKYPNFTFKLCLSKPDETWHGFTGHITDCMKEDYQDLGDAAVYLCGNQEMITQSTDLAKSLHCPPERIYFEKFY